MYNFNNLSDYEFESLCRDIMERKLQMELSIFPKGRDGGIDITEDPLCHRIVIQAKHYANSKYTDLLRSLKEEVLKVQALKPERYYICTSMGLTPANKSEIYKLFSDYMESANDIIAVENMNAFLEAEENSDIIRKHYKLWLESTNVLSELMNQNVFVDCESLLYNIEEERREFVATDCYRECIDILDYERMLLLLGMPGTGKTMTTKMLALYYASKGYRIRYTTNGELTDLKRALSAQKDLKEVLLLDDCLGQHYFKMKETAQNELLSLVKYVSMNRNKKLIMNSIVTIFQEAKERSIEFKQFAEDERFRIKVLDMGKISIADKGKIFYNHIYFKGLSEAYYQDICRKKNYRRIVDHKNYTPRIIEFVTRKVNYQDVPADQYFDYVMRCLKNPTEIWKDEFTKKIQPEDRILLTTLYSLTETTVSEDILKRAFNYRLKNTLAIDTSSNVWDEVLRRLEGAFIIIVEKNGGKEIGVVNPSVNDFLKQYLEENELEQENVKKYATESAQILRGFSSEPKELMETGEIMTFHFANVQEQIYIMINYLCECLVFDKKYQELIKIFFDGMALANIKGLKKRGCLLVQLLDEKFDAFYHTRQYLTEEKLADILWYFSVEDYEDMIRAIDKYKVGFLYDEYENLILDGLMRELDDYLGDIDACSYCDSIVEEALEREVEYGEDGELMIPEETIGWLQKDIEDAVYEEISTMFHKLPEYMLQEVKVQVRWWNVSYEEAKDCIYNYFNPSETWHNYSQGDYEENNIEVLDQIFR